jgi:hypothetical protein
MQIIFGSGKLVATRTDVANSTPVQFGALQDVSVDFNSSIKELFGTYQMPIAVARGTMKISGKAKFASISGRALGDLFFGSAAVTGERLFANDELGTVAAAAVTVANAANWVTDLGVVDSTTGVAYVKVASAPAVGQYSVAAGVYGFNVTDNGKIVKITYDYSSAATGQTINLQNQLLGVQPVFSLVLFGAYNGKNYELTLNRCVATKFTFANKLEDFNTPDFEFGAFSDDSNNLGKLTITDKT